jgi:uncharacterized protein (TIGR03382 family)
MLATHAALLVGLALAAPALANVSFSDDTFADANWQLQSVVLSGSPSAVAVQRVGGGNPGDARRVTLTTTAGGDIITAYSLFGNTQSTRYVPSTQGAIANFSFAIQARTAPGLGSHTVFAAIRQGNNFFVALPTLVQPTGTWQSVFSSNIAPENFFNLGSGPSTPDFSATGAPMRVGFAVRTAITALPGNYVVDYDNFFVDITPVPGPGALALVGAGVVVISRRRRA